MFKKPLADLKTSASLRGSDRKKLRQRILQAHPVLQPEEGDALVPDGLQAQKFSTHVGEPGVAYLSAEGDPLWFTIGKGSDELVPTVYTLWKRPDLLPFLSTPAAVVPKLIGGADLMIPGVVQHSPSLASDRLVSITQYHRDALGPPLAIGRMAVSSETLRSAEQVDVKGKAVLVLHTWKDLLWEMGTNRKADPPAPREAKSTETEVQVDGTGQQSSSTGEDVTAQNTAGQSSNAEPPGAEVRATDELAVAQDSPALNAQEISDCLRAAVLQAIEVTLSGASPSTFPIPASTFWSSYVLPSRPARIPGSNGDADASAAVDVKHSTYKNVKTFLKACAKEGLLKLKETKGDIVITAVYPQHPAVASHRPHRTVRDIETKLKKAEDREQKEREAEEMRKGEIHVEELWKPFGTTVPFFVAAEKDTSDLCTSAEIRDIVNGYIATRGLVNANDQQYINVGSDQALYGAVSVKGEETPEFMKREEVLKRVRAHMQSWYEVRAEGQETVRRKGELKPISVVVKIRQGRKACTLVTGYEPFGLQGENLAEELRKTCASSTAVSPLPGKANSLEVMVQGRQIKSVMDLLIGRGVPKKWIESADLSELKKKK